MSEKDTDIIYFVSFCMEQYKTHKGISGIEVSKIFEKYHVFSYLIDNYNILHTQSHHWLNIEIDQLIEEQNSHL